METNEKMKWFIAFIIPSWRLHLIFNFSFFIFDLEIVMRRKINSFTLALVSTVFPIIFCFEKKNSFILNIILLFIQFDLNLE